MNKLIRTGPASFGGSFIPMDVNTYGPRFSKLQDDVFRLTFMNKPGVARRAFVRQKSVLSDDFAAHVDPELKGDAWLDAVEAAMNAEVFRNCFYNRVQWLKFENKQHTTAAEVKPYSTIADSLQRVFG